MNNKNIVIREVETNNMTIRIKSVFEDKIPLEKAMSNIIKLRVMQNKKN